MDLLTYISDMERRRALASQCGTTPEYLWQVATAWKGRKPSHELAKRIEDATQGAVTRYELREDIFGPAPSTTEAA